MIPKPVYCGLCGGFTGFTEMVESWETPRKGEHADMRECIQVLSEKIESISRVITEGHST